MPIDGRESDTDVDPEYRDWCRALVAARQAVIEAREGELDDALVAPPRSPQGDDMPGGLPVISAPDEDRSVRRMLIAASVGLLLTSGFFAWRWLEQGRLVSRLEQEIARIHQPEVAVPWLLAPFSSRRSGEALRLVVPAETRSIALMIDADAGDHVEVRSEDDTEVWSSEVVVADSIDEILVLLPADLLPPGLYEVTVDRQKEDDVRFVLWIDRPAPTP